MRKIAILFIAPFLLLSTLSAQITQQEADEIVKERLGDAITSCLVYAQENVQTEGTSITTAVGETLEMDYSCWVYYARFAENGKYLIIRESNGNVLEVNAKNDGGPEDLAEWRRVHPIQVCGVDNPLTDLPWLKAMIDGFIRMIQEGNEMTCYLYQCTYKGGETGFLDDIGNTKWLYDCEGELLCILGGALGETCPEWEIVIGELLWWVENGFIFGVCEFEDPLEDLPWLKRLVDIYTHYFYNVSPRHFKIYQCVFKKKDDNEARIGFAATPAFEDAADGSARVYECTGTKAGYFSDFENDWDNVFLSRELIWEIKE